MLDFGHSFSLTQVFLPGLFIATATIATYILLGIKFRLEELLIYVVMTELIYLLSFSITFFSQKFFFIVGILAGGAGACAVFSIINWTLFPIRYSKWTVFMLGGLAFFIYDILLFTGVVDKLGRFIGFNSYLDTQFAIVVLIWQIVIGMEVFYQTRKSLSEKYGS